MSERRQVFFTIVSTFALVGIVVVALIVALSVLAGLVLLLNGAFDWNEPANAIAVEPTSGETHLRHHVSPTGFYRGKKVLKTREE